MKYIAKKSRYYDQKEKEYTYLNLEYKIFGDLICDNAKFWGSYV